MTPSTGATARGPSAGESAWLSDLVHGLSAISRPSASDGERRAAEWVAARFAELGVPARLEAARAHGTYWIPLGLLSAAGALGGAMVSRGRRRVGGALAGAAAVAVWDDLTGGRRRFRRLLARRTLHNVVAEVGREGAGRTVVLVAHHDAARWGLVFHPGLPIFLAERVPALWGRLKTSPPLMWPVLGGPAAAAVGAVLGSARLARLGTVVSAGAATVFGDIAARGVVPGANDNATGVAVVVAVARALIERPTQQVRVLLLSTGSEESMMEGMQAFAERHFASLPRSDTFFLCVDTVGSQHLAALRGEGMMDMRDYPSAALELVDGLAEELGIHLFPGLRFRNGTDTLYPLNAGYPCALLASVNHVKVPANYHWPTDTAENVDYGTLFDAVRLAEALVRRLDEQWYQASSPSPGSNTPGSPTTGGSHTTGGSSRPETSPSNQEAPKMNELDRRTIQTLAESGADLSQPLVVEHFLALPGEEEASHVEVELRTRGHRVEVVPPEAPGGNWTVAAATGELTVTEDAIAGARSELTALADSQGGEYQGWGAESPAGRVGRERRR